MRYELLVILTLIGCGSADSNSITPSIADLRKLPGIHSVTVSRPVDRPTTRIIHILNWHYVTKSAFAADLRNTDDTISDDEINQQYDEFLDEVEAVQTEQIELLRAMIDHHGVQQVAYEGLTAENVAGYKRMAGTLRDFQKPEGNTPIEQVMLLQYQRDVLEVGSPGRLLMTGELADVFAPEDSELLKAANPIEENGDVRFDTVANEKRESAIVEQLLRGRNVAVIILGGGHDLSDNVPNHCDYIRVQLLKHRDFAGEME